MDEITRLAEDYAWFQQKFKEMDERLKAEIMSKTKMSDKTQVSFSRWGGTLYVVISREDWPAAEVAGEIRCEGDADYPWTVVCHWNSHDHFQTEEEAKDFVIRHYDFCDTGGVQRETLENGYEVLFSENEGGDSYEVRVIAPKHPDYAELVNKIVKRSAGWAFTAGSSVRTYGSFDLAKQAVLAYYSQKDRQFKLSGELVSIRSVLGLSSTESAEALQCDKRTMYAIYEGNAIPSDAFLCRTEYLIEYVKLWDDYAPGSESAKKVLHRFLPEVGTSLYRELITSSSINKLLVIQNAIKQLEPND